MWSGMLLSNLLGTELPGPGTVYVDQSLSFDHPVMLGDTVTASVTAREKLTERHQIRFDCKVVNQRGETIASGQALVQAPTQKICRPRTHLPQLHLVDPGQRLLALVSKAREGCKGLKPMRVAVVHPVNEVSIQGAIDAAQAGLIEPVWIGPEARIARRQRPRASTSRPGNSCPPSTATPPPRWRSNWRAAARSAPDERRAAHRRIDARRLRRPDRPAHRPPRQPCVRHRRPGGRPAAVHHRRGDQHRPGPRHQARHRAKRHRTGAGAGRRNAAHGHPRRGGTVNANMAATLHAAALCKMADRGQITGAILDGPLAFDNALSLAAAKPKASTRR
jgi:Phosphotransacetylase